ncbi:MULTISPECIES: alpha/beta hydrolase [unclassified Sphingomonas]|uniref:alpha/beta hydrolase n=1 Tax=unclassified Sphingomonas TaxID=196159 RepID=UPI0021519E7F|nr:MULTISPECIES: alpha/beta hydrolase [unclassified Sphingomonas]MCR5872526.1 alpha/beta hydrolase [Sphingomonas sp. J344]UUX99188.1 alpha/beta hydrolase [Sphingomonas sp. J315]
MRARISAFCGAALLAMAPPAASAQQAPTPPPLTAEDEAKLAPIAPELRAGARLALGFSKMMGTIDEAMVLASRKRGGGPPIPPRHADIPVVEKMIPGPVGAPQVKLFVINAKPGTSRPGIVHTHGGGYILGTAATDVRRLQDMARELDAVIVSVEYRLAPETTYQGSIEDNYAGLSWMYRNAAELGLDRSRIAVTGESAGGGHAALLAITARDRGEIPIAFQALVYPMLDDRTGGAVKLPGHIATVGWSGLENQYGWKAFLGQEPGTDKVPARAVPARTQNLAGLPPAFIQVGGVDLFVSEDIDYARRLNEAGVPTELQVIPGAYHGFDQLSADSPQARQFNRAKIEALRRAFARPAK